MKIIISGLSAAMFFLQFVALTTSAQDSNSYVQCPAITVLYPSGNGIQCGYLLAGEEMVTMVDDARKQQYIFSYAELPQGDPGEPESSLITATSERQQKNKQHDEHAAHRAALSKTSISVSTSRYSIPDVDLINSLGAKIKLSSLLNISHPIALNFIFTTCTTICPVMTATFAQMQMQLGERASKLQLISISIDPEYDRPDVLRKYSQLFGAYPNWTFLTGSGGDIEKVVRGFDAYFGSKMNHQPLTLLKSPDSPSWIRVEGLAGAADLANIVTNRLLN